VQGKAETCSFSTAFTCTCGTTAAADYTTEMTRGVLLAGITDTDIRVHSMSSCQLTNSFRHEIWQQYHKLATFLNIKVRYK